MTEPLTPKILILEGNETLCNHAREILSLRGWVIHCEATSKKALQHLEESRSDPFSLFISNFKLPEMEGDDIHKNAKAISPMTQRMLMVPADEHSMVIRAINKGGINSCIIYPFKDEDLVNQAANCLAQFKLSMKHLQLKRVIAHQNKQLFQIARKLKKKDAACQKLIGEKKTKRLMLKTYQEKGLKQKDKNKSITLEDRIDQNNIPVTPATLQDEFFTLCSYIKTLFDATASKTGLDPVVPDYQSILSRGNGTPPAKSTAAPDHAATDGSNAENDALAGITQKIIQITLASQPAPAPGISNEGADTGSLEREIPSSTYFEISLSKDKTKASIQTVKENPFPGKISLSTILDFLRDQKITYGVVDDEVIETWIAGLEKVKGGLMVARGEIPENGVDGYIDYHFDNDYTNPGKLQSDGTIDFRDRGGIPYTHKGELLAEKTPAKPGKNGMDVFGEPILIKEVMDPVFISGRGTELKEDGLSIYADLDGQPHVDAVGNITVNPELMIKGDVDFETGNVNFNGNIIVKGMVKDGFKIKGISLTAQEIEGGVIELSGDLNVANGITEATIASVGNVHAKFINNSTVMGFGDIIIQKEIIDSEILISGACQNQTGHVISSKIVTKQGIEAGKIGTTGSRPATLKVGVDEHIQFLIKKVEEQLEKSLTRLQEFKEKIESIETLDHELYGQITQKAQTQEKAQNEKKEFQKTISNFEKLNDMAGIQKVSTQIKESSETAKTAEQELNKIFETQDLYAKQINQLKEQINHIEKVNKKLIRKKKALRDFSMKTPPLARALINGKIIQGTAIHGPNASMIIKEDLSRCQIQEQAIMEEGQSFYDMVVSDL